MQREIAVKLRDKSFIWGTVLTVVLLIAALALPAFIGGGAAGTYNAAATEIFHEMEPHDAAQPKVVSAALRS